MILIDFAMAPPSFADLGKDARDLFSKGFQNGVVKLDLKTVAENKVEFKVAGTHNTGSSATDAKLEAKYKIPDYGFTLTETWDTKNILGGKFELEDKLRKGLKITLDSSFNTVSGQKDASLKTNYKQDYINFNLDSGLALAPPVINAAGVFSYQGWLAGGSVSVDTAKNLAVKKSQLAIGYSSDALKLHSYVKDLQEFGASVYHKVNRNSEVGIDISWVGNTAASRFALAAKHKIDANSFANFSVDNKSNVNLGYTNTVSKGVKLTGSVLLDAKALSGGDHKVGLGLDLEL
jgi:hypothetical protein